MKTPLPDFHAARKTASLEISSALTFASSQLPIQDRRELHALAERIKLCSDQSNLWSCETAVNFTTGEEFHATGKYWKCGNKLCPGCLADHSRENRNKLRKAIERQELRKGERYNFTTLTVPNLGLPLQATRQIVNRAWELLRKRLLFTSLFRGGCKSEEFTLTPTGYHYHLHLLTIGPWFLFQELRRTWTECVLTAAAEAEQRPTIKTSDGLLLVKVLRVTNLERGVLEVCKYVTKSDSWSKMRPSDLAEVGLTRRWFRMFELFGSFAARLPSGDGEADEASEEATIVHTGSLTDADAYASPLNWRDYAAVVPLETYIIRLQNEFEAARAARTTQLHFKYLQSPVVPLYPKA